MQLIDKVAVATFLTAIAGMPLGLLGQDLSIGGIGGGSLTDAVQTETVLQHPYVVTIQRLDCRRVFELRFRSRFSVEVDAMYRELHATIASVEPNGSLNGVSPFPVVTFEFPVLAKYRFGAGTLKPFVEAGPSFRATGNLNFFPSHHGVSAGFGVETHWRGLNIAPVVRYTRWAQDIPPFRPVSQLNQVELLVGVSRASESHWSPLGRRMSLGVIAEWELTNDISPYTGNVAVTIPGSGNTSTQANATEYVTGVKSLIGGPVMEIHLPRHLSVELDGFYRPLREHYKTVLDNGTVYSSVTYTEATTWQFPVLAKYRFRLGKVNPFAEAGPSFRLPVVSLSADGVTAGAGVEMHWHALHIAPAFRFTRWGARELARIQRVRPERGYAFGGILLRRTGAPATRIPRADSQEGHQRRRRGRRSAAWKAALGPRPQGGSARRPARGPAASRHAPPPCHRRARRLAHRPSGTASADREPQVWPPRICGIRVVKRARRATDAPGPRPQGRRPPQRAARHMLN